MEFSKAGLLFLSPQRCPLQNWLSRGQEFCKMSPCLLSHHQFQWSMFTTPTPTPLPCLPQGQAGREQWQNEKEYWIGRFVDSFSPLTLAVRDGDADAVIELVEWTGKTRKQESDVNKQTTRLLRIVHESDCSRNTWLAAKKKNNTMSSHRLLVSSKLTLLLYVLQPSSHPQPHSE